MKSKYKKQKVFKMLESELNINDRYLCNVIEDFNNYLEKYTSEGYTELWFEMDYNSYGDSINLMGTREETDEEFEKRIQEAEKIIEKKKKEKEKKEASERALYLKLKKKYDKGS